ncbi:hypothetical protein CEXT_53211 [Caerostris extrusa]|uniref:Uncharacterized protein n=1 Tax=Caerostris extrusa TaxID=172846 RepID=A0AAV4P6Z1_CAEEX|nr:hypothetical protein CEXT_53211 [Caerostris extrusa]
MSHPNMGRKRGINSLLSLKANTLIVFRRITNFLFLLFRESGMPPYPYMPSSRLRGILLGRINPFKKPIVYLALFSYTETELFFRSVFTETERG